jgi:hypothetical protein
MIVRKLVVLGFLLGGLFVLSMIPQQANAQGSCQLTCADNEIRCEKFCNGNETCLQSCVEVYNDCIKECD